MATCSVYLLLKQLSRWHLQSSVSLPPTRWWILTLPQPATLLGWACGHDPVHRTVPVVFTIGDRADEQPFSPTH